MAETFIEKLRCDEADFESDERNEPEGHSDVEMTNMEGNNHSTRRRGTHTDEEPASPNETDDSSDDGELEPADSPRENGRPTGRDSPVTPVQPPEPNYPPTPAPSKERFFDRAVAYSTSTRTAVVRPTSLSIPPAARTVEVPTSDFNAHHGPWHTPAILEPTTIVRLGMLATQDLPRLGKRPENVELYVSDVENYELAYPYCRRYARHTLMDTFESFRTLGLQARGYLRRTKFGADEFALHPVMLSSLINADWRLESQLGNAMLTPIFPATAGREEINTARFRFSDERFPAAPMFMPMAPAVAYASRLAWLPVQRGLLLAAEEMARAAVLNQSTILHAVDEIMIRADLTRGEPALAGELGVLLREQTATTTELLHHLIYAHQHAYVKECPVWLKHGVLRQPVFDKRQLFLAPEETTFRLH